ncbi:MAG: DNA polymerase III subunit epsilon [Paracoccus sp. (in: a-proteobacteria)]|nr:DNA polymerase III subunit epsilon [Paracoccus sp. (in: a-proteobacteria)]
MREIVLDTETTGFRHDDGDRIVEIGAVELLNHLPTGKTYHQYINPERDMPEDAFRVHGLSSEFLSDKPRFAEIAAEFVKFIGPDSKLVIHNASFDIGFLDAELTRAGLPAIGMGRALDTLMIARTRFPGAQNTLDALCRRFGIDNSNRTLHGALLDSELLAEVYLELVGGRQPDLVLDRPQGEGPQTGERPRATRPAPLPSRLTEAEATAHAAFVEGLGENALWRRYGKG